MKVIVENIAKVKRAEIEINGISVIAGENNTGKSTIAKGLYSLAYAICGLPNTVRNEKERGIFEPLRSVTGNGELLKVLGGEHRAREFAKYVVDNYKNVDLDVDTFVTECFSQYGVTIEELRNHEQYIKEICEVLNISDKTILCEFVEAVFGFEFDNQINSVYDSSTVGRFAVECDEYSASVKFLNNDVTNLEYSGKFVQDVTYVDDPFVLHNRRNIHDSVGAGHRRVLWQKINRVRNNGIVRDIRISDMLSGVYEKVGIVCDGDISFEQQRLVYKDGKGKFYVDNLSAGLKTFAILKTLLQNGGIGYGDIVILDEPEIHLHPEWQVKFAEIIVLLQKTFGLNILISTHSPYFLDALERYSEKHGIAEKCKYYLSEEECDYAIFNDVTGHIDFIYKKLVKPLDDMDGTNNATD